MRKGTSVASIGAVLGVWMLTTLPGLGQIMNPADAQKKPESKSSGEAAAASRLHTWELPPIKVVGEEIPSLVEEQKVGEYEQPRWTATRRFPTTRVYIIPEGKLEVEYWLRTQVDGDTTKYREMWEFEMGLPYRLQLDFYHRTDQKIVSGTNGAVMATSAVELRYAFADWGRIPGNPTVYLEWLRHEEDPDQIEAKLLLGGEIVPRWHWGLNLIGEFQLSGDEEHEYAVKGGLSYTAIDSVLSIGAEAEAAFTDAKGDRGNYEEDYLLGPSVQIHPLHMVTVNLAALFGLTKDSTDTELWVNIGCEF